MVSISRIAAVYCTVHHRGMGTVISEASKSCTVGLRSGFDPPDLERPGRLPHQQGLCEARLGYRDGSPQLNFRLESASASFMLFISVGPGPQAMTLDLRPRP